MSKRFLVWVLGTFFIMTFILSTVPVAAYHWFGLVLALLLIVGVFLKFPKRATVLSCIAAALFSVATFSISNVIAMNTTDELLNKTVVIEGQIVDVSANTAKTFTCYKIDVKSINHKELPFYNDYHVKLFSSEEGYLPGTTVIGSFDFADEPIEFGFGKEDRVFLSAFENEGQVIFSKPHGFNVYSTLFSFKESIKSRFSVADDETEGLLNAVCLGDKDSVDPELYISLKNCGLSHVMAVSGLHLSFVVLLFGFLLISARIHYRIRHIIGIFIAIIFTIAVGAPLSCVRACIMLTIYSLGVAMDWFSDNLTSLSVAAFIVLLANPFAMRDVGFLLSLSATFGIVVFSGRIEYFLFPKKLGKNHRIIAIYRKFTGIFATSIAASLSTLPIIVYYFRSFSLIGPFANLILILIFELFFMIGILMILLGWIPYLDLIFSALCEWIYVIIKGIATFLGRLPFAGITGLDYAGIILLALFIFLVSVSLWVFIKRKERIMLPLFAVFLIFSFSFSFLYRQFDEEEPVKIAFIDVGQGDCTVISKNNRAIIIDYGGSSDKRFNLINYLNDEGINTIDLLAFTHLHNDHTNGIHSLLKNVYVENIVYPELSCDSKELSRVLAMEGQPISESFESFSVENIQIDVISDPIYEDDQNQNERCVCYKVHYGDVSLLITGDLTGESELKLLDKTVSCTILKVGHHGSANSSFYPFIKEASPEIAVISVGENGYGLPSDEVYQRIETVCAEIYSTMDGTIEFITDGKTLERVYE